MLIVHLKNFSSFLIRFVIISVVMGLGLKYLIGMSDAEMAKMPSYIIFPLSFLNLFLAWMWAWKTVAKRWLDYIWERDKDTVVAEVVEDFE